MSRYRCPVSFSELAIQLFSPGCLPICPAFFSYRDMFGRFILAIDIIFPSRRRGFAHSSVGSSPNGVSNAREDQRLITF